MSKIAFSRPNMVNQCVAVSGHERYICNNHFFDINFSKMFPTLDLRKGREKISMINKKFFKKKLN